MNATQENTTTGGGAEERPRCEIGSATSEACWREATDKAFECAHEPVNVCAEHKRDIELGWTADAHAIALDKMQEWIVTAVNSKDERAIQPYAWAMREKAEIDYYQARVKADAARRIARQGPDEEPLSVEQAETHERLLLRANAFVDAQAILEDLPEESFGVLDRYVIAAVLEEAGTEASAEHERYKREIGRK